MLSHSLRFLNMFMQEFKVFNGHKISIHTVRSTQHRVAKKTPQQNKLRLSDLWKWNGWTSVWFNDSCLHACICLPWTHFCGTDTQTVGSQVLTAWAKWEKHLRKGSTKKITKLWVSLEEKESSYSVSKWLNTLPVTPESIQFLTLASGMTSMKKHLSLVWQNLPESDVAWWSTNNTVLPHRWVTHKNQGAMWYFYNSSELKQMFWWSHY